MVRIRIQVRGIVQGVGFRPFVYRQAARFGLSGFVQNTGSGVTIEIEGESAACTGFLTALTSEAPPLSRIITPIWPCWAIKRCCSTTGATPS